MVGKIERDGRLAIAGSQRHEPRPFAVIAIILIIAIILTIAIGRQPRDGCFVVGPVQFDGNGIARSEHSVQPDHHRSSAAPRGRTSQAFLPFLPDECHRHGQFFFLFHGQQRGLRIFVIAIAIVAIVAIAIPHRVGCKVGNVNVEKGRRRVSGPKCWIPQNGLYQPGVVVDSLNDVGIQSLAEDIDGLLAGGSVRNDLGEHRIVKGSDNVSLRHSRIQSQVRR
mmetsp:Transcript_2093/g.4692  ORF Transcript_2093/g.4692 Transcript_2093/m.4692 type:complete len:223 (+) Transcript_2093:427-1095(+)